MFWDKIAGVYGLLVLANRRAHKDLCDYVETLISPDDEVLECACGTGMLSVTAARKCRHLTATDFSEKMLKQAEKNCRDLKNITFAQADIMNLPYPDSSFDIVMAGNVIHLLDEPLKALAELERVCRPGGKMIIPTYMSRKESGKSSVFSQIAGTLGADFKNQFSFESYKQFFREAGFTDGEYKLIEGRIPCAAAVVRKWEM